MSIFKQLMKNEKVLFLFYYFFNADVYQVKSLNNNVESLLKVRTRVLQERLTISVLCCSI